VGLNISKRAYGKKEEKKNQSPTDTCRHVESQYVHIVSGMKEGSLTRIRPDRIFRSKKWNGKFGLVMITNKLRSVTWPYQRKATYSYPGGFRTFPLQEGGEQNPGSAKDHPHPREHVGLIASIHESRRNYQGLRNVQQTSSKKCSGGDIAAQD